MGFKILKDKSSCTIRAVLFCNVYLYSILELSKFNKNQFTDESIAPIALLLLPLELEVE